MMKRPTFILFFITIHISYMLLHIHKHTVFIKELYMQQKNEKTKNELEHKLQQSTQQLYALRDYSRIEKFARNTLNMHPIHIRHIKKLSSS